MLPDDPHALRRLQQAHVQDFFRLCDRMATDLHGHASRLLVRLQYEPELRVEAQQLQTLCRILEQAMHLSNIPARPAPTLAP